MRTISVVTVARSDYGIYRPLLQQIQADPELDLRLLVGGMHLSPTFGLTVREIVADGFMADHQIEMLLSSDTPEAIAKSMGLGVIGFAQVYAHSRPDILIVLGDRFDMYVAALAALPFRIPVAHIHGGELTQGAIDDALRHAMTKLSHLHFVSTPEYARRVLQLGEEPWRVTVSGALSLDNARRVELLDRDALSKSLDISLPDRFLLVTYHPVTLEYEQTEWQIQQLLAALDRVALPVVFTMPNADTGGRVIIREIDKFVCAHPASVALDNLGVQRYFSTMNLATAMVGNSSSGIVEAAMFKLPVVNVGTRQQGRIRSANIIDVGYQAGEIVRGIAQATSFEFLQHVEQIINAYGDGQAAQRITRVLRTVDLRDRLLIKAFVDYPLELEPKLESVM